MKRIFMVALLMIVVSSSGFGQAKGNRANRRAQTRHPVVSDEPSLMDLERQWMETYKNRDPNILDLILADDFIITDDDRQVYNHREAKPL